MPKLIQNYEIDPNIISRVINYNTTLDIIFKFITLQNIKHIIFIDWDDFLIENMYNESILKNISDFFNNDNFNGIFLISNKAHQELQELEIILKLNGCLDILSQLNDFKTELFDKINYYILVHNIVQNKLKHIDIIDYTLKKCYGSACMDIEVFYITRNFCRFSESAMFKRFVSDNIYNFRIIYFPFYEDVIRFGGDFPKLEIQYDSLNDLYYDKFTQDNFNKRFLQLMIHKQN